MFLKRLAIVTGGLAAMVGLLAIGSRPHTETSSAVQNLEEEAAPDAGDGSEGMTSLGLARLIEAQKNADCPRVTRTRGVGVMKNNAGKETGWALAVRCAGGEQYGVIFSKGKEPHVVSCRVLALSGAPCF
jgi:hypothetical protein